jgi:hypothetical protein
MASAKELKIIKQAKADYEKYKKLGDTSGMAAAHLRADQARGYSTVTKANQQGKYYQSVVSAEPPVLPKAPQRPLPSTFRNAPAPIKITPEQQAKNTQTFLNELKSNQGGIAAAAAGLGAGLVGGGKNYMAPETRQAIEGNKVLNRAFTGGQIAGSIPGFAAPYAAASKPITAAVSKLPALAKLSPLGQRIAGSVATDLAVGLPLNANYAINSEGLRGTDALKSIALNTGIDVATGGLIEGLPAALKALKSADNKIPVVQPNGKVSFVTATLPRATTPAPTPRVLPKATSLPNSITYDTIPVKGVDGMSKNNKIVTLYHGGSVEPSKFDISKSSDETALGKGFYATDGKGIAEEWAKERGGSIRQTDIDTTNFFDEYNMDFNDPRYAKVKQLLINSGLNPKFVESNFGGAGSLDYMAKALGRGEGNTMFPGGSKISNILKESGFDGAVAEFRDSKQYVSYNAKNIIPKAPTAPVQPRNPNLDAEIPKEQAFAQSGGLPKAETYNKALMQTALDEYDRTVESVADYIANYKPKGVDIGVIPKNGDELMRDGSIRYAASKNDQWYQEYYKANGKRPSKAEAKKLADKLVKESLRYRNGEFYNPDLGRLMDEMNGGLPKVEKATQPSQELKSLGADTFKGGTIQDMVDQYGAIEKGMAPRREVRNGVEIKVPKETPYGEVSKAMRTFQESKIVKDDLAKLNEEAILDGSVTKRTVSNQTVVDNANTIMDKGVDEAYNDFKRVAYSGKQPTSDDIALGARLVQELQNMGQNENALDIELDMLEMLSESGRTLQAAQIIKKLSPEGRLMSVARVARKISKTIGGQKVTVSDETMNMIRNAKTEGEIIRANERAATEMWEQVPSNFGDKANAWRYTAMLFNPKTHVRNIVGNAMFIPARYLKNVIGAGLEKTIIRNGERTKSVLNVFSKDDRELMEFARNDFKNEMKDVLKTSGGGKLDNVYRPQEATVYGKGNLGKFLLDKKGAKAKIASVGDMYLQLFKKGQFGTIPGETMELIRRLNIGALDIEDTWFMRWAYDGSFAQYMKANGLKASDMTDEVMQKAREYAGQEALKATYRDANSVANAISRAQRTLAKGSDKSGLLNFGMKAAGVAIEGLAPFKKTPLNIVKRAIAYSPANLIRGVVNMTYGVKSGKVTATEAIDELAAGIAGTGLVALGAWLGFTGLVTGKEGEWSDKLNQYQEMLGQQNYSMNINGKSYTLDWAAPNSLPFFVGVEIARSFMEEGTNTSEVANILDAMTQISDPMINLSMLKGLNELMTGSSEGISEKIATVAMGYAGQYNPTLFGQIARTVDDTRRSTISTAETKSERTLEKFGRKQVAKLPMASKQLEPYVDLWGREQKNGNALENFLSPGYFKQENITPVDKELLSLTKSLDKETAKKVLPTSTAYQYTVEADSESYRMSEKESTQYQKTRGQESFKGLAKLFNGSKYSQMDEEEKVKAVTDVYSKAAQTAKVEYLKNKGLSPLLALSDSQREKYATVTPLGVKEDQYLNSYNATRGIEGIKDDFGKTIYLSESYNKKQAIDKANPGASPKELRALYHAFGVSEKVW